MKMPIPPLMACCMLGIALIIDLRILVTVMMMLTIPQIKTIVSACCHVAKAKADRVNKEGV